MAVQRPAVGKGEHKQRRRPVQPASPSVTARFEEQFRFGCRKPGSWKRGLLIGTKRHNSRIRERFNRQSNGFGIVVQLVKIKEHRSAAAVRHNCKPYRVGSNIAVGADGTNNVGGNLAGAVPTRIGAGIVVASRLARGIGRIEHEEDIRTHRVARRCRRRRCAGRCARRRFAKLGISHHR